jgi:hypothetical protein
VDNDDVRTNSDHRLDWFRRPASYRGVVSGRRDLRRGHARPPPATAASRART